MSVKEFKIGTTVKHKITGSIGEIVGFEGDKYIVAADGHGCKNWHYDAEALNDFWDVLEKLPLAREINEKSGCQIDTSKLDGADSIALFIDGFVDQMKKQNRESLNKFEMSQCVGPADVSVKEHQYKVGDILIRKWNPVEIILKDDLGDNRFNAHEVGHLERTWSGIHRDTLNLHFDLKEEKTQDNVNQPKHYTQGGIETIDFIEAKLTREEVIGAYKFNIIKYSVRSHLKNGEEDLRKMNYYSDRLIKFLEKK